MFRLKLPSFLKLEIKFQDRKCETWRSCRSGILEIPEDVRVNLANKAVYRNNYLFSVPYLRLFQSYRLNCLFESKNIDQKLRFQQIQLHASTSNKDKSRFRVWEMFSNNYSWCFKQAFGMLWLTIAWILTNFLHLEIYILIKWIN